MESVESGAKHEENVTNDNGLEFAQTALLRKRPFPTVLCLQIPGASPPVHHSTALTHPLHNGPTRMGSHRETALHEVTTGGGLPVHHLASDE